MRDWEIGLLHLLVCRVDQPAVKCGRLLHRPTFARATQIQNSNMNSRMDLRKSTFDAVLQKSKVRSARKPLRGLNKPRMPSCRLADFCTFGACSKKRAEVERRNQQLSNNLQFCTNRLSAHPTCKSPRVSGDPQVAAIPQNKKPPSAPTPEVAPNQQHSHTFTPHSQLPTPHSALCILHLHPPKNSPFPILACHS
jgi:hypothetical protein